VTTEVTDADIGSVGSPATGRKLVSADGPSYQRTKGGLEESNVSTEPE
jgi:hypothetical protein